MVAEVLVKSELRRLADEVWKIVLDPKSSRIERIESAKIIAACKGVLLPCMDEQFLSVRQIIQLRRIKEELTEKALKRKATRRRSNRRAYLRRKINDLESQPEDREDQKGSINGEHLG
jgi:hypothetical protein